MSTFLVPPCANARFYSACGGGDSGGSFIGTIDDVRVYDSNLTTAEIGYIASDGRGTLAIQSIADLHKDPWGEGVVNFKDFDKLADKWLKEEMWPQ